MLQSRRCAAVLLAVGFVTAAPLVSAQNTPNDSIYRNLLERQQREAEFHVNLYDNRLPTPSSGKVNLPLPLETAPRSTLDLGPPLPPNPNTTQAMTAKPDDSSERRALDITQRQRLQQLQLQNQYLDEPVRQQQMQIQQLQFDRENQAQSLHDHIMRDSQGAMRQTR